jgi:hypothetical protein
VGPRRFYVKIANVTGADPEVREHRRLSVEEMALAPTAPSEHRLGVEVQLLGDRLIER